MWHRAARLVLFVLFALVAPLPFFLVERGVVYGALLFGAARWERVGWRAGSRAWTSPVWYTP